MDKEKIKQFLLIGGLGIAGIVLYFYLSKRQSQLSEQADYIPVFAGGSGSSGYASSLSSTPPSENSNISPTGNQNSVPIVNVETLAQKLGFAATTYDAQGRQHYPYITTNVNPYTGLPIASYVFADLNTQKVLENLRKHYSVYLNPQGVEVSIADAKRRLGVT